jgi:hypothetical protein
VHQAHAVAGNVGGVQGAGEELVVGAVDRVAALEGHDISALGQGGAHLCSRGPVRGVVKGSSGRGAGAGPAGQDKGFDLGA